MPACAVQFRIGMEFLMETGVRRSHQDDGFLFLGGQKLK
ncbi:hypothetical protein DOT_4261 [Desulfosporosinus sp. OT]|nr:hypothetical protein DOT_4261 [Desulfosporosinus sp. OT]